MVREPYDEDVTECTVTAGPQKLYLDLLHKTLLFTLWPEPPIPVEPLNYRRSALTRFLVAAVSRVLRAMGLQLTRIKRPTMQAKIEGRAWPGYADTMIGMKRLSNVRSCIETVLRDGVEGDLIETGVWRGGSCIFMRAVLAVHEVQDRRVFVADSFEGLPEPDPEKYPVDSGDKHHVYSFLAVSQEEVEENFRRYGLLDDQVVFLKGWFKDTLPSAPIETLAVLRLDGDMYGSTMDALESLYPKLSPGGFCIIDDYSLPGCRKAVHDYLHQHGLDADIEEIDWTGSYWRKAWD